MLDYSMFDVTGLGAWVNHNDMDEILKEEEAIEFSKAQYALEETKKRLEKANTKQAQIDNLKYEKELILGNVFDLIREDIAQSCYNIFRWLETSGLLLEAWKYSLFKSQKRLKEIEEAHKQDPKHCKSLKDFRDSYNFVIDTIKKKLIPDKYREDSTLVEIIDWCCSTAYEFTFKYKDIEFIICVPMFNNVNNKNYLEMLSGYILRFRESDVSIALAFNTINPNEFKEKLELWIDERLKESKND